MIKLLAIGILAFALTACSSPTYTEPNSHQNSNSSSVPQQEDSQIQKSIWISSYVENSKKPQPELMSVINEAPKVSIILKWLSSGTSADINQNNVENLYVINVTSEKDNKTVDNKYYLYAITKDGKLFIKEINPTPDYDLDKFEKSMTSKLIQLAGIDNWFELKPDEVKNMNFPT